MIREAEDGLDALSIVAVDIGNTNTRIGRWVDGEIADLECAASIDTSGVQAMLARVRLRCENQQRQAIVIASVVPNQTAILAAHIDTELALRPFVIGENTPLPMEVELREPEKVGIDRVCAAAAAFDHIGQACIVIDVGSAVTVDYVDASGIFQGGAILPGPALQAQALNQGTAQLPAVNLQPGQPAIGKDTASAIASGICVGLAGAIRGIVEEIASEAGGWPQTVLTGGGATLLIERMDFIDSHVPNLCLMGVGMAYVKRALRMQEG